MRVIPGRYRETLVEHGKSDQVENRLSINQAMTVTADDEARAMDCVLNASQMSMHDGMVPHGSLPNRLARRRCGLTIRYIPNARAADRVRTAGLGVFMVADLGARRGSR